jgi:excisionase family DNA binding protein
METLTISVSDAAKAIGIGKTTLYRLINTGQVTPVRIGRRTLIETASVRALVKDAA